MKINRKLIIFFILTITLVGIVGCRNQDYTEISGEKHDVIKWRMVTHQMPGTSRYEDTIIPFVEAVKEASGGRLIIEPYGAGVLFPVSETLDHVRNGIVEASASWDGNWSGKDPVFSLAGNIPMDPIRGYSEHFYRSEKLDPILKKAYNKHGVEYVGPFDFGPLEILMSTKAINTLEDFKGINVRAAGIGGDFYNRLGASVVSLSSQEIYTALQLGTVDAAEYNDWIVNMEMGFDEVTKYVIEPVLHTGAISDKSFVVNPKAWEELPDDLKEILRTSLNVPRFISAKTYEVGSELAMDDFLKGGSEIINLSEEEIKKAEILATDLILEYKDKNDLCEEYIRAYRDVLYELGYEDIAKELEY